MKIGRSRLCRLQSPYLPICLIGCKTYRCRIASIPAARELSRVVRIKNQPTVPCFSRFFHCEKSGYFPYTLVTLRRIYYAKKRRTISCYVNRYSRPFTGFHIHHKLIFPRNRIKNKSNIFIKGIINSEFNFTISRRIKPYGMKIRRTRICGL